MLKPYQEVSLYQYKKLIQEKKNLIEEDWVIDVVRKLYDFLYR